MKLTSSMTLALIAAMTGMAGTAPIADVRRAPFRSRALQSLPPCREEKNEEKLATAEAKRQRKAAKRLHNARINRGVL